ncbi:MAG: GNAT family N-acetyltransferase [Bacteroidota bacterium]
MDYHFSREPEASAEDQEYVIDRLRAYNDSQVNRHWERRMVRVFVRDETGEILAGVFGMVSMHALVIDTMWVDPRCRGKGIGGELLARAEAEAREAGAIWSLVDTTSFQARPFYEQHGYQVFGQVADLPIGHTSFFMRKRLNR